VFSDQRALCAALVAVVAIFPSGCSRQELVRKFASAQAQAVAKEYIDELLAGDFAKIEADADPRIRNPALPATRVADTLAAEPQRGSIPKELRALGLNEYRQVFFKPYRIVYRIHDEQVVIYLITDGRRNMQTLLSRRLLRG
jgi:mRNA-degrading endonuclease RelE of RelBE toxin-antitoxin system